MAFLPAHRHGLVLRVRGARPGPFPGRQARDGGRRLRPRGGHLRLLRGAPVRGPLGHAGIPGAAAVPRRNLRSRPAQGLQRVFGKGVRPAAHVFAGCSGLLHRRGAGRPDRHRTPHGPPHPRRPRDHRPHPDRAAAAVVRRARHPPDRWPRSPPPRSSRGASCTCRRDRKNASWAPSTYRSSPASAPRRTASSWTAASPPWPSFSPTPGLEGAT